MMFSNVSAVIGNVEAGQLRALAVTSAQRIAGGARASDHRRSAIRVSRSRPVRTGHAGWTPRDIVMRLNAEAKRSMHQPDAGQRLAALGMTIDERPRTSSTLSSVGDRQVGQVIRDADIKAPDGNRGRAAAPFHFAGKAANRAPTGLPDGGICEANQGLDGEHPDRMSGPAQSSTSSPTAAR